MVGKKKARGRRQPDHFVESFDEGENDFAISITKVFPPEVKSGWAKNAYLIKLRLVLNLPAEDWKYFTALADTIKKEKMFCGIWTPDVGDVVIDDYGCYVEMVSYLKTGNEDRLVHLDKVIQASPKLGTGTRIAGRSKQDDRFVEVFVNKVRSGDGLEKAMEATKDAMPSSEPVEPLTTSKYVIGGIVVVQGGVADKLTEAEKKVEEELEDED